VFSLDPQRVPLVAWKRLRGLFLTGKKKERKKRRTGLTRLKNASNVSHSSCDQGEMPEERVAQSPPAERHQHILYRVIRL